MINFCGVPIFWITLIVFLPTWVTTTELVKHKGIFSRLRSVYVAWFIGMVMFTVLHLIFGYPVNLSAIGEFVILAFIGTKTYEPLKPIVIDIADFVKSIRDKFKGNIDGN